MALADGVADGDGGSLGTVVGVGTGGSVSGGSGDSVSDGRPPAADELGSATGALAGTDGRTAVPCGGRLP